MVTRKGITNGISKNNSSNKATNMERTLSDESFQACKGKAFTTPVRITVISYRSRLADADGISAKAAIDGIVHAGILADDSPKEVVEVRHLQHKVKNKEDERTEIEIETIK